MPGETPFFDTCYLVRLYLEDHGFEAVRRLAGQASVVAAAWHAQAEVAAAFHRAYRERGIPDEAYSGLLAQFAADRNASLFAWQPLNEAVLGRVEKVLRSAPTATYLRAADALHLACAAEHGFTEAYSSDRHFLAAAPIFGIRGIDVLPPI
jgi:predicted nucleic acid-binding protein